jgi:hypothetical protein
MAQESTQPLTETSTRNISWAKGGQCIGLTTFPLYVPIVLKSGSLNLLEPSGHVKACNGIALPLTFQVVILHALLPEFQVRSLCPLQLFS